MEKIKLKFSATPRLFPGNGMEVVMTLDEKGKKYRVVKKDFLADWSKKLNGELEEQPVLLPKRVLDAFTENAINKILSKDEIPNESGMMVLDGNSYEIRITKGGVSKEYDADEASIETYPLLRYLASWYRRK